MMMEIKWLTGEQDKRSCAKWHTLGIFRSARGCVSFIFFFFFSLISVIKSLFVTIILVQDIVVDINLLCVRIYVISD